MLAACGDSEAEEPPLAPLAEVCGVEGPMRLLELAPDRALAQQPWRIGERIFYRVGRPSGFPGAQPFVPHQDIELWTTGLCGEAPTRLPAPIQEVVESPHWPGLPLACDDEGNLLSLAPTGPPAPHEVFHGTGCRPVWTARGAFSPVAPGSSNFVLHRYPDDPRSELAEVTELLEVVVDRHSDEPMVAVDGEGLLAFTPTRKVVHVDLDSGAVTVVHEEADGFAVSPSGRYYLWASAAGPEDENGSFTAVSMLHDRVTGEGVSLGRHTWPVDRRALEWADQGSLRIGSELYNLSGFESVFVPGGYQLEPEVLGRRGPLADGRWIVRSQFDGTLHYLDVTDGTLTQMTAQAAQTLARGPEGVWVHVGLPCCSQARADQEGPVWLFPADGSAPRQVAERATLFAWPSSPDVLITLLDLDFKRGASLTSIDIASLEERHIDDHVFATLLQDDRDPDLIRYSVQDGERSGVWQVRLPR